MEAQEAPCAACRNGQGMVKEWHRKAPGSACNGSLGLVVDGVTKDNLHPFVVDQEAMTNPLLAFPRLL